MDICLGKPLPRYHLHRHRISELTLIVEGSGFLTFSDSRLFVSPGDLVIIPPRISHGRDGEGIRENGIIFFDAEAIIPRNSPVRATEGYRLLFQERARSPIFRLHLHAGMLSEMISLFTRMLCEYREKRRGYDLALRGMFCELICMAVREVETASETPFESSKQRVMREIANYFEAHYTERLTLADLAVRWGMSKNTLMRRFRSVFRTPPIDYLIRLRVDHAAALLVTTENEVTDIALSSGFNDVSNFIHTFKRIVGTTPSSYRRKNANAVLPGSGRAKRKHERENALP